MILLLAPYTLSAAAIPDQMDYTLKLLPWIERIGIASALALIVVIFMGWAFKLVLKELIAGYKGEINDLRMERDKLQELLAVKISSTAELKALQEENKPINKEKKS